MNSPYPIVCALTMSDPTHVYPSRRFYIHNYNSPSFRKIHEQLRAFVHSADDDHEVRLL